MPCSALQEAVVFLNPPYKYIIQRKLRCSPRRSGYIFPPLELLSLASGLNPKDALKPVFIDAIAERLTLKGTLERLKGHRVKLLIFMPGFESFEEDFKAVSWLKGCLGKETRVACFGYLPSRYYKEIFRRFPLIDYAIVGEPETTFRELCRSLASSDAGLEKIKGLALNKDGEALVSGERKDALDLESLPFPDRRLLKNTLYSDPFLRKPMTAVITSRGCPYQCSFCADFYGKAFRQRSAESVSRELEHIACELNIRNVRFMDDNLTTDKVRLMAICREMTEKKMELSWTCLSRVDTLDKEVLGHMAGAGCKAIFLGIESGSQRILDYYKKGYSVDLIQKQCALIKSAGIDVVSWFMVGAPQETADDVRKSLKLALEVNSDFICLNELKPLPGTAVFSELKERVSICLFPFSVNYAPLYLTPRQVAHLRRLFYIKFYLAPKTILRSLWRFIKDPSGILFFLREFISATRFKYIEK